MGSMNPVLSDAVKARLRRMASDRPARMAERRTRLAELKSRQVHEVSDLDVDDFFSLQDEKKERVRVIKEVLKPSLGRGYDDLVKGEIKIHEQELAANQVEYEALLEATEGSIVEAAFTRLRAREAAAKRSAEIKKMDANKMAPADKETLIAGLLQDGLIKEGPGPLVHKGRAFVVSPNSEMARSLFNLCVSIFDQSRVAREERRDEYVAEAAQYMLSTEELQAHKSSNKTLRSLKDFLSGKGLRSFVRVTVLDNGSGESRFVGEALLERNDGNVVCRKVTPQSARLAHMLFFYSAFNGRGKKSEKVRKQRSQIVVAVDGSDISEVQPNILREAMRAKLERDGFAGEKREAAEALRDVSKVEHPLTFDDLRGGEAVGICPVDITIRDGGRVNFLTFHLEGDGNGKFKLAAEVPGTAFHYKQLKAAKEWQRVQVLNSDEWWRGIRFANREFERDWQLELAAQAHGASYINRTSAQKLMGVSGADGTYAVKALWFRENKKPAILLAYVVERKGSSIKIVWALPGDSERLLGDELGGAHEIESLPRMLRAVFRNIYFGLFNKRGERIEYPDHLMPAVRAEEKAEGSDKEAAEPVAEGVEPAPVEEVATVAAE